MVHITSLVMKTMQFNHFHIISLWELLLTWQPNHEADHQNCSYFELSLPKQHLYKIRVILLQWFRERCHLQKSFFKI